MTTAREDLSVGILMKLYQNIDFEVFTENTGTSGKVRIGLMLFSFVLRS